MKYDFIEIYLKWLKENMFGKQVGDFYEITTPFLDRHNDCIQIYAKEDEGNVFITDDGYTVDDLISSGCDLTDRRKKLVERIVKGYGIRFSADHELFVNTSLEEFAVKKHALIQAILSVNDLYMTSKSSVLSLFCDEVAAFLDDHDSRYSPNIDITGETGFVHKFDFLIPGSKTKPEILMKAINNPNLENSKSIIFQWEDTKKTRKPNTEMIVLLNDENKKVSASITSGYKAYGIMPVVWKDRDKIVEKIA